MATLPASTLQPQTWSTPASREIVGTVAAPRLTALEWSIVAMAQQDGLSSIREPGRYTKALRSLFGLKAANRLANDRLESLRRIAILAWHHGWNVPKSELKAFLEAGFTTDQFELIQNSLGQARAARRRRRAR
jgi:hypothetical protein